MQFHSLKLTGFKSFVESTEVEIAPGLTGIVGPNGCGKSNIVEALRWVMGETSAKRMRGGEMDDVIFAGSANRPQRNIAEVVLTLANKGGPIPTMFEQYDEIEVRRRIDRGEGSDYRVNGKPARARDIQLLFADAAIGSNSPAMVSQGRIAALISAKPVDRRFVLEDAAGIGGLQSRRHEAELKLRAAETNLEQLGRVLETLKGQEAGLKRQAKQAEKYRQAAERIREIESLLLYCAWLEATQRQTQARDGFDVAEEAVRAAMIDVASTAARESAGEADIVSLRRTEQESQTGVRGLAQRQTALESERRQIDSAKAEAGREIEQASADLTRETQEREEAERALEALHDESATLQSQVPAAQAELEERESIEAEKRSTLAAAEDASLAARGIVAEGETREAALARQLRDSEARYASIKQRLEAAQRDLAAIANNETIDIDALLAVASDARGKLETAQAAIEPAAEERRKAERVFAEQRQAAAAARDTESRLRAEIGGVEAGLRRNDTGKVSTPALERISAQPGFEAALAAALGEESRASLDAESSYRWVELPTAGSPPHGTQPLAESSVVPPQLRRAVAGVGIADGGQAAQLQAGLQPGQAIVTREGALYRWDGLVREPGGQAVDPVAATLAQRNRLSELQSRLADAERGAALAAVELETAQTRMTEAQHTERAALDAAAAALRDSQRSEAVLAEARNKAEQIARREAQAREGLAVAQRETETAAEAVERVQAERSALPDLTQARAALGEKAEALTQARAAMADASASLIAARREADRLMGRVEAIGSEISSWSSRIDTRAQRIEDLAGRIARAKQRQTEAGDRPDEIARDLAQVMTALEDAEQQVRVHSDSLIRAETDLAERRFAARAAEKLLASAREDRVRAEAGVTAALEAMAEVEARTQEKLNMSAQQLCDTLALEEGALPDRAALETKLASLTREREAVGPVNLRAELELEETAGEISKIESESAELSEAIARLRQAITKLNGEARERLVAAFETVRVHFKRLFATLFGGGETELALTNMEDPLEAGLEIYASPPGKKLQNLSLLSGGEQALTALSLLFAMFLATPAPVCVLDEVDAPLDDANVTRFCDLLDEISAETGTRFLIITHHRVTMARMDRLYGVTMAEKGVSMLVSVDLRQAEMFADHDTQLERALATA